MRRNTYGGGRFEGLGAPIALIGACLALGVGGDYAAGAIADATYGSHQAEQYLEQNGYKHPVLKGVGKFAVQFQGCSKTDEVAYTFEAQAPNGAEVQELVCKGIFKGATLRQG